MMRAVINRPTGQRRDASAKGLAVTECCNRLGVDCDTWQRWERGQEAPPLPLGCQLAELFGVESRWLAHGRE